MQNIFYVSLLHPYLPGGTKYGPNPIFTGENQEYEIERTVAHKNIRGRFVYQVRWRSYDIIENSWFREENLANASNLQRANQLMYEILLVWTCF